MNITLICKFLVPFSSLILSSFSSNISFKDEQKKIMKKYEEINSATSRFYNTHVLSDLKLPVESLLALDPIIFFKEMQRAHDACFLITFWNTFDSFWIFNCPKCSPLKDPRGFIEQIFTSHCNHTIASEMLYHFKVYLTRKLLIYSGNREEMLSEAMVFFNSKLKHLIQRVFGKNGLEYSLEQSKVMNQSFLFYHWCSETNCLKSILISEFFRLQSALNSTIQTKIDLHSKNLTFLAGALMGDLSTLFGLTLISDQLPEFIGYFLVMQRNQNIYLRERESLIKAVNLHSIRRNLLNDLFARFPIFEFPLELKPPQKFVLHEFVNHYGHIMDEVDLIELVRTLFHKIISL
jgi:hypothetical protein